MPSSYAARTPVGKSLRQARAECPRLPRPNWHVIIRCIPRLSRLLPNTHRARSGWLGDRVHDRSGLYATRHFPDVAQPARVPPALGADPLARPTIILSGLASSAQDCRTFGG